MLRPALGVVFVWFIVKNLALLAAGLVVGSTVRGGRSGVWVESDEEES